MRKTIAVVTAVALSAVATSTRAEPIGTEYRMGSLTLLYFEENGVTDSVCSYDRQGYEAETVFSSEAVYRPTGRFRMKFPTTFIRTRAVGGIARIVQDAPGSTTGTLRFLQPGVYANNVLPNDPPHRVRNLSFTQDGRRLEVGFDLLLSVDGYTCGIKAKGEFLR